MNHTTRHCRRCNTEIHLLLNPSTNRWMPVDVDTNTVGNIAVDLYRGTCQVLAGPALAEARLERTELHLAHHVTCPKSDRFARTAPAGSQTLFDPETAA